MQNLAQTAFKPLFGEVAEVVQQAFILPLRHRVTNVKVDLALGLSGFEQRLLSRAERLSLAGAIVAVATAEDILVMKVLAGRPQDDQDVQGLVVAQGKHLDWSYCLNLARELGEAVGQDLVTRVAALQNSMGE